MPIFNDWLINWLLPIHNDYCLTHNDIHSGPSLKRHPCQRTPSSLIRIYRIIWQQVLWMPLILPLTEEHLSNEDRIIWQKGVPIRGGPLYRFNQYDMHIPHVHTNPALLYLSWALLNLFFQLLPVQSCLYCANSDGNFKYQIYDKFIVQYTCIYIYIYMY